MFKLLNEVDDYCTLPTYSIVDKITISQDHKLDESIKKALFASLNMLGKYIDENSLDIVKLPSVNIIFTNTEKCNLVLDGESRQSSQSHFIIFRTDKMINEHHSSLMRIIIEEFCHYIWGIEDEELVCYKVVDVIRTQFSEVKLYDVFSKKDLELRKAGKVNR